MEVARWREEVEVEVERGKGEETSFDLATFLIYHVGLGDSLLVR